MRPGAFYPATVLSDVDPSMRGAFREELFGPVAVLYRVSSAEQAVEMANDSPFGLGAAVFGRDEIKAQDVATAGGRDGGDQHDDQERARHAFGGVKSSGVGRELGRFGLDEFANKKLVRELRN